MITLGLDTAGPAASAAIWMGPMLGGKLLGSISEPMERGHAEAIMPIVSDIVGQALGAEPEAFLKIDRVAVLSGPGSFTGVRIGVAAARGLGLAIGCPVIPVTRFEAQARLWIEDNLAANDFAVAFDARRRQLYLQCFAANGRELSEPAVVGLDDVAPMLPNSVDLAIGSGAELLEEAVGTGGRRLEVRSTRPHDGAVVARLGAGRSTDEPPLPLYLRRPDAKPQRPALARATS